jgi:RimJ/RimL family protein N-acetyltransferase
LEIKESYAICLKENGAIIGSVSLKFKPNTDLADKDDECELGFWIGKPYWNKGFATEAAKEITRHGFEDLNASIIWVANFEGNQRSAKVQEKLGFVFHHIVDKADSPQSQTTKKIRVSFLNKEEWLKRQ